jgi:hypothetical protein
VARNNATGELEELTIDEGHAIQKSEQEAAANYPMERLSAALTGQPIPPAPMPTQMMERPIRCYYQAFTCGGVLLHKQASPIPEARRIPYVPVYGYFDKVKREHFGVVRNIADVQRQTNVEQSALCT